MPYEIPKMKNTLYRPSNGTEGDIFQERFCRRCKRDREYHNMCDILAASMCFSIDDERYPEEWTHDEDGRPVCTAHEPCEYQPLEVPDNATAVVNPPNENEQTT